MSNLVDHAKRELEAIGEEPEVIDWYLTVVQAFASFGHSGGSAAATVPVIYELLQYHNLTPLTNDPSEWTHIAEGDPRLSPSIVRKKGLWQNKRRSEAFSHDGGDTYYLLSEGGSDDNPYPKHKTGSVKK